jgi:hypothetical protein
MSCVASNFPRSVLLVMTLPLTTGMVRASGLAGAGAFEQNVNEIGPWQTRETTTARRPSKPHRSTDATD